MTRIIFEGDNEILMRNLEKKYIRTTQSTIFSHDIHFWFSNKLFHTILIEDHRT